MSDMAGNVSERMGGVFDSMSKVLGVASPLPMLYSSLGAAAVLFVLLALTRPSKNKLPPGAKRPPGPKGQPIVGNLLELPDKHIWLKFHEYIQEFGPIVRLNIMGQDHILLGTEQVVDDLVQKRGAIYNSRPQTTAANMLTQGLNVLFMPSNDKFRMQRRFLTPLSTRRAAPQYEPYQYLETLRMVTDMVRDPSEYQQCFEHWSNAMGSRMLYGRSMPRRDDEQREILDITHTIEQSVTPGAFLVDVLPWLRFLPEFAAPWKASILHMSRRDEAFFVKMWNRTKADLARGVDAPSYTRAALDSTVLGGDDFQERELQHLIGVTYTAFGTSSANMMILLFAMARHPEWWARMQAEMDAAVGAGRLPVLEDLPNLPTLRAVLCEVTRVWPVTPAGVPHELVQDDVYGGYHLKAGSMVHIVTWSCGRDPARYSDPEAFRPERWLEPGYPTYRTPLAEYPTLVNTLMFGAGRRQCPGMHVGARNVYIQAMSLVWACDLGRARDGKGEEVVPPFYDFVTGFNVFPKPFKFDLKARSAERMAIVEAAYKKALAEDKMRNDV